MGELATKMYLTDVGATCAPNEARVPSASLYCILTSHECPSAASWQGLLCKLLRGFFATSFYAVCQKFWVVQSDWVVACVDCNHEAQAVQAALTAAAWRKKTSQYMMNWLLSGWWLTNRAGHMLSLFLCAYPLTCWENLFRPRFFFPFYIHSQ